MSSLPAVIPANAGISGAAVRRIEIPGQARDDVSSGKTPKEDDR